jgi:exodeoxyribonuclease V gamma subunit
VTELPTGIVVYRASRLEALLDPFAQLRAAEIGNDPLRPTRIIAAHPGIQRWLVDALARRAGPRGVVANLDLRLPSTWLDDLAVAVLGGGAVALAPYRRESLRWRILDVLERIDEPGLVAWLAATPEPRQRLQLAHRLAGIYAQHLVYRPDWLLDWQRGRRGNPEYTPLAPLWQRLRADIGQPHRAERMAAVLAALDADPRRAGDDGVLHVFGVSHLPPLILAALRRVARCRLVAIYMPDPCVQHWAGLRNERSVLRSFSAAGADAAAERDYLDLGHPLLASLGRMGQHFGLVLNEGEDAVVSEQRHWADRVPQPEDARCLLGRVQESIRQLEPSRVENCVDGVEPRPAMDDDSLRVHAFHTRLRELEVLRETLLQCLADDPALEPRDIVVMAPDIAAYLPLVPAVFGPAATARGPLPWHAADVGLARTHPMFEAALALLALPDSRASAPDIAGLLDLDPVARALGIDADGREAVLRWLGRARIAWGFDASSRAQFDVPPIDQHTFAWGLSRMLAGFVYGADRGGIDLPLPGLLPVDGVEGAAVEALGALDRLLSMLDALRRDAAELRPAREWLARLQRLFDGFLAADIHDRAEVDALALLMRALQGLSIEVQDAGCDPLIDFASVRELLRERLDAAATRAPFLPGAIAFCGMVPQRAVPFAVIAVLGLDDGAFPRRRSDGGLDPMARHPRLGDRDPRSDDRYLFLETLMAARSRLHLSYLGEGAHDGKRRAPAAPLAELLAFLDARHGYQPTDERTPRPWLVRHPLQPFDRRYFDHGDPRLVSRDRAMATAVGRPGTAQAPFLPHGIGPDPGPLPPRVPLAALRAYYRDPAKHLLLDGLGLRLDAMDDDTLAAEEPMDAAIDRLERVERRLVIDALARGGVLPEQAPPWLAASGMLAPGRAGELAWQGASALAAHQLDLVRALPGMVSAAPSAIAMAIDVALGTTRLQGELPEAWQDASGTWWVLEFFARDADKVDLKVRVPLFIAYAALALMRPDAEVRAAIIALDEADPWSLQLHAVRGDGGARADLAARLEALAQHWYASCASPGLYFPRVASAVLAADGVDAAQVIADAWAGDGFATGERDFAPGYARLLGAGCGLEDPDAADVARVRALALRLGALIGLPAQEDA